MNDPRLADIIAFAMAQKTARRKALYLLKGIVFYPFLAKSARGKADAQAPEGQADFAYPVF